MTDNCNIPDNPLEMPPPYWDDCGSMDMLIRNLEFVSLYLGTLVDAHVDADARHNEWEKRRKREGDLTEEECDELVDIYESFNDAAICVWSYSDSSILMAAITIESLINKYCVYNLHRDIVEPLEKLTPTDKLTIASAIMGYPGFRHKHAHEAAKKLFQWRNAYAHGHCVTTAPRSFLNNHLRNNAVPHYERPIPTIVTTLKQMIRHFITLSDYISEMTINPYVVKDCIDDFEIIRNCFREISTIEFKDDEYPYEPYRNSSTH